MDNKGTNESGFTLLHVLVAIGMVSILAVMTGKLTGNSKDVLRTISKESHIMDLRHYLKTNFSCEVSKKKYKEATGSSCPTTLTPIDAYRENEELLAGTSGTEFYKFRIHAECQGDEFHFYYSDKEVSNRHIFNEVPISCSGEPQSNLQVFLDDTWNGICCSANGAPPLITSSACDWREVGRALIDDTSGLYLDCPANGLNPAACTCTSALGETYHGVGSPSDARSSLELIDGAPLFPESTKATCIHVNSDGSMSTIYSVDGATSSPSPPAASWDIPNLEWTPHPDGCHHFRLLDFYP
ncbi:MAG: type II secretion system protein [Oligoflexales bacterium]